MLICSGIIFILFLFKIFLIRKYGVGDENMDIPSVLHVLLREKRPRSARGSMYLQN
jgi:uncharacterized protein (DUF111 family)